MAATAGGLLLALSPDGARRAGGRARRDRRDRGDTPGAAADHRQRDRDPPGVHLAAGRTARPRGRGELRRHLPAPLPWRPALPRRPARPAHRALRRAVPAGRRAPGRDPHRAAGRPVHLRPEHGAGHPVHGAGHARQPRAVRADPRHHGGPVTGAHPRHRRGHARAVDHRARVAAQVVPGELGRAAAVRRGRRGGGRGHRRGAGSQGVRPGGAGAGAAGGGEREAVRVPAADDPAHRQVQPRADRCPVAGHSGRARARRLAGHPRLDHAGHVPGVLRLPGPDDRPGADVHLHGHARAGGAGQRHPGVRHHRLAAGHHRQAGRDRAPAGRGRAELRRRPVRLPAVRAGAARPVAPGRAGRDGRRGRRVRLGQVHPGAAAAAVLRPAGRLGPDRRSRCRRRDPRFAARRDRAGHGGQLPILRHDPGQHRLRPAGRDRRGGHRGGPGRPGARVHYEAAAGLRHRGGRAGPHPFRRPAAAGGAGPGADHRPPGAAARRRDFGHRPAPGGRDSRRAARGDAGPDHADHRAPPVHAEPGRPDRGPGFRPGRRHRHARRARGALPAVPAAHRQRGVRRRTRSARSKTCSTTGR